MSTIFDVKANPKKVTLALPCWRSFCCCSHLSLQILVTLGYVLLTSRSCISCSRWGSILWWVLLDLSYIAFYATGAYLAAIFGSQQFAVILESFIDNYPAVGHFLVAVCGPEITKNGIHLSVWMIVPFAAVIAGAAGALLGAPTLKLRGDYLAIVTLGFGEIVC